MKNFILNTVLFLCVLIPCSANTIPPDFEIIPLYLDRDSNFQLDFHDGYTNATIFEYQVKVTAQQRMSDNLLQAIAIPREQGIRFRILNIRLRNAPPNINISGPVAEVEGIVTYQRSTQFPIRMRRVVPVQITSVSDFSISQNEAEMQGYSCFQKKLSHDFSDSTGH